MRQQLLSYDAISGGYEIPNSRAVWALLGLRGVIGLHSEREDRALQRHATGRKVAVEIGVAEGASARTLKSALGPDAQLTLIDPYVPGRIPGLNLQWFIARRHVGSAAGASVRWVRDYSFNAVRGWEGMIDFLFIDGDHAYESCLRDFTEWSPFVSEGGLIALHDARVFKASWTNENSGPVRLVNEMFRTGSRSHWAIIDEVDSLVVVRKLVSGRAGRSSPP
jgi:predicted O-methyltransferase YrrM